MSTPLYWVGGSGTWDTSATTHWSTTSGGLGGGGVPDSTTPVILDGNSNILSSVIYDNSYIGTPIAGVNSQTTSYTVGTGANRILVVGTWSTTTSNDVSGITYAGVAMTQIGTGIQNSTDGYITMWYLLNPTSGTNNIVVSFSDLPTHANSFGASYSGAKQSGQPDASSTFQGSVTSWSQSVTTVADYCETVAIMRSPGGMILIPGTNTTVPQNSAGGFYVIDSTTSANVSPSSLSATWSGSASEVVASIMISIAPYSTSQGAGATITEATNISCASLTCTGFTGTLAQSTYTFTTTGNFTGASGMTWSGTGADTLGGNFTLVSGMTNSYTGAITFNSTSSQTITNGGVAIGSAITFNGVGGTWTLQDSANWTAAVTNTNGTLVLNNLNHSLFSYSNAGTITMGTGTLTLTGTGTVWNSNGGSFTQGTSTIKINDATSASKTFHGGGLTYYDLYLTGAGTGAFIISGSNTFNNFKCDTPPHTIQFSAFTTQTLDTFTVSGTAGNLMTLESTTNFEPWYLVKSPTGTVVCDYLSLRDSHVS